MEAPILLSSEVTSLATGQTSDLPTAPMQNPFRRPMWVDEIRVQLPRSGDLKPWHAKIRIEVSLGRTPLTSGFIPVGNLTVVQQHLANEGSRYVFQWKLPKPLYVPATELLRVRVRNVKILGDATAIGVRVAVVGRSIDDVVAPDKISVPWVAFYEPVPDTGLTASSEEVYESAEGDIANPFDQELRVQRFIGRGSTDGGEASAWNADFNGATAELVEVQAADSFGRIMARDPIAFTSMFFYGDNAWTVNSRLQPKGFYAFKILNGLVGASYANSQWVGISMIGYREIPLGGG